MDPITRPAPTPVDQRFAYLDILRGVAVLMIFAVNIKGMMMPFAYYWNGALWPSPVDGVIADIQRILIDDKWRSIFTMLYGAGLVLISDRAGEKSGWLLLRRNLWLGVFGAFHMIFIWGGDILFAYALSGLLAMLFRQMGTGKLFWWGGVLLFIGTIWGCMSDMAPIYVDELRDVLEPSMWLDDPDYIGDQIYFLGGTFLDQTAYRFDSAIGYVGWYMLAGGQWLVTLGLMVSGMALYRAGLLKGQWPVSATVIMALILLAAAYGLDIYQIQYEDVRGDTFVAHLEMAPLSYIDAYLGAVGYAAMISVIVSMRMPLRAVAATGRMAFTNYIACSLIGTTLAGGHLIGFSLYGRMSLVSLMMIVIASWAAILVWSPLWLSRFRYGPLEWLWRSLVYGRRQPILKKVGA